MAYTDPNAPARVDYLYKVVPANFKAANTNLGGQAIAQIGPDQGQYWYPTFVTVATNSGSDPSSAVLKPVCTLYVGAANIFDNTTYIDDTTNGNQDSSSIISGTIVQPGNVITAVWDSNDTSGNVVMKVYGYVSNVPLSANVYLPSTPGTHFQGHLPVIGLSTLAIDNPPGSVLNSGQTFTTSWIDLSKYESFSLILQALNIGAVTGSNPVAVSLNWAVAPFNQTTRNEFYEFYANEQSGIFNSPNNGQLTISDQCHGNWLQIVVHNDGPDQLFFGMGIAGNSRPMGAPYVRECNPSAGKSADNLLLDVVVVGVGAGANQRRTTTIGCGRVFFRLQTVTQPFNFDLFMAGAAVASDRFAVPANTLQHQEYVFPNRGAEFSITNTGAGAGTYVIQVFRQMPPY